MLAICRRFWSVSVLLTAFAAGPFCRAESAPSESKVRRLMAQLRGIDDNKGYYVAVELSENGSVAMPHLACGLSSPDPATRKWSARAMGNMVDHWGAERGREIALTGAEPLLQALKQETDPRVLWYMAQAVGTLKPPAEQALPILVGKLKCKQVDVLREAIGAIAEYGPLAKSAKPDLLKVIEIDDNWLQLTAMSALRQIGLEKADLAALGGLAVKDTSEGAQLIFDQLLSEPDLAFEFVGRHPVLLAALPENHWPLVDLFSWKDEPREKLRQFLLEQENLPKFIRVDRDQGETFGFVAMLPHKPRGCFPQYTEMIKFAGDKALIEDLARDPKGHVWFKEDLARISRDGNSGFIDRTGRIVIAPKFDRAENFSEGIAVVWDGRKAGYIRKDGSYLKEPQYEWAYWFKHGLGSVKQNGKFGLINKDGQWVLKPTYENLTPNDTGFDSCQSPEKTIYLDKRGKVIPAPEEPSASKSTPNYRSRRIRR